ncbi:MAG: DUF362 domain-containing protein, partial [Candidatus Helarchaeota archaeon]
ADAVIVLSHFKGHPMGTFGGAIKNIGVGCASQRGKLNLHMGRHPKYGLHRMVYNPSFCIGEKCENAERCEAICPVEALKVTKDSIEWDREKCIGCTAHTFATLECGVFTSIEQLEYLEATSVAIADSAKALVKLVGKDHIGFINLALDVTPWCDCISWSDTPIVPNIGLLASTDPVALDRCCIDMVIESPGMIGSVAESKDVLDPGLPKLSACGSFLGVSENIQVNTGAENGLGELDYKVKNVVSLKSKLMPEYGLFIDSGYAGRHMAKLFKKKAILPDPTSPTGGFKRVESLDMAKLRPRRK